MAISYDQVIEFLSSISIVAPDQLDCGGCFELFAEFVEAEERGDKLTEPLKAVQNHLRQCPCCAYEYETLVEAIREADKESGA